MPIGRIDHEEYPMMEPGTEPAPPSVSKRFEDMDRGPEPVAQRKTFGREVGLNEVVEADPKGQALGVVSDGVSIASYLIKHVPGLGMAVSIKTVADLNDERAKVQAQMVAIGKRIKGKRSEIAGIDVEQFLKQKPDAKMSDVLDNTLVYALHQKDRHLDKVTVNLAGNSMNIAGGAAAMVGVHAVGIGALPGVAVSAVGSGLQAGVAGRSLVRNLFRRFNGILGIERERHARLLYGMAVEHLNLTNPDSVPENKLTNAAHTLMQRLSSNKNNLDYSEACKSAYDLLAETGVLKPGELDNFFEHGFTNTATFLRSRS